MSDRCSHIAVIQFSRTAHKLNSLLSRIWIKPILIDLRRNRQRRPRDGTFAFETAQDTFPKLASPHRPLVSCPWLHGAVYTTSDEREVGISYMCPADRSYFTRKPELVCQRS